MGKLVILSITDCEEHIINKIMELIADEPEFIHLAPSPPQSALSFPGLEIRLKEQTVYCNSTLITLTYHEFAVLTYLARHPGWVFSAHQSMKLYGAKMVSTAHCSCQCNWPDPSQADARHTEGRLYPHCTGQRV